MHPNYHLFVMNGIASGCGASFEVVDFTLAINLF